VLEPEIHILFFTGFDSGTVSNICSRDSDVNNWCCRESWRSGALATVWLKRSEIPMPSKVLEQKWFQTFE